MKYIHNFKQKKPRPFLDPTLDFLFFWKSDSISFCENNTKLYFDVKHLEKEMHRDW